MYSRTGSKNTGICTTGAVPSQSHDTDVAHLKPWAPSNTLEPRPPPAETGNHHAAASAHFVMDIQFRHVTHAGDVCSSDGGREREWGGKQPESFKAQTARDFFKKKTPKGRHPKGKNAVSVSTHDKL